VVAPGTVTVAIDRWSLAEELWLYGEDTLYLAPLDMSDTDLIDLWLLAGTVMLSGRARSGSEAAVMAAVELLEGNARPLARTRRRPRRRLPNLAQSPEERMADVRRIERTHSFPHPWR
jgi:hypothetical protein